MAVPGFAFLSESVLRALPMIERGVRQGISRNALQGILSRAGLGIRRADLLATYNAIEKQILDFATLQELRRDLVPPLFRIPQALTTLRRQFSYRVIIDIFDRTQGVNIQRHVTIVSDSLLPFQRVEQEAVTMLEESDPQEGTDPVLPSQQIIGVAVEGILRAGEQGSVF